MKLNIDILDLIRNFLESRDEDIFLEIINRFEYKIKKSTFSTSIQERNDLEQEIKIKIFEKLMEFDETLVNSIWDYIRLNK